MTVVTDIIGGGFVLISGFGVWRGQSLWSRHIELKHERELARLSMERLEKSVQLEIAQNKAMAEIERLKEIPALPAGDSEFDPGTLPFICGCRENTAWHIHVTRKGLDRALPVSLGFIEAVREGRYASGCVCNESHNVHVHFDREPDVSLSHAGYSVVSKKL